MNRITQAFQKKDSPILTVYLTAGYPNLGDTLALCKAVQDAGADIIEIGIPFSDPLADGPVIQHSSEQALANGMTIKYLFEQLRGFRSQIHIPVLLMGYFNPVLRYGVERFCADAHALGIDGLILPDLPFDLYQEQYKTLFATHKLANVFLITPQSSPERIRQIDDAASGFIYMVATASTTGTKTGVGAEQTAYFERIAAMKLKNPVQIGFGIATRESYLRANQYANGAIIGSALIKAIADGDPSTQAAAFVQSIVAE
ncbi:MAG: hypothetical protein RIS47_235 [Bacteroidota bacterium]|jgi:tryptophan synthase alpha chain